MIDLGLHGWDDTHDSAAALVVDGELVASVEEERLTRRKHAPSLRPRLAAHAVLRHAGLAIEDVDAVAYGWDLPRYYRVHGRRWDLSPDDLLADALGYRPRRRPELVWVGHHLAHAELGFRVSGFSEATVVVVGGQGEDRSASLYAGDGRGLRLVGTGCRPSRWASCTRLRRSIAGSASWTRARPWALPRSATGRSTRSRSSARRRATSSLLSTTASTRPTSRPRGRRAWRSASAGRAAPRRSSTR